MNCIEGGELAIGESLFSELEAWPAASWTIFLSFSQAHLEFYDIVCVWCTYWLRLQEIQRRVITYDSGSYIYR